MPTTKKPASNKRRRPGPVEERLIITEDPASAFQKLFKPKPSKTTGQPTMRVPPFHSSAKKDVHHVCSTCTEGNNIEARYKTEGTGGLPMCINCAGRIAKKEC